MPAVEITYESVPQRNSSYAASETSAVHERDGLMTTNVVRRPGWRPLALLAAALAVCLGVSLAVRLASAPAAVSPQPAQRQLFGLSTRPSSVSRVLPDL